MPRPADVSPDRSRSRSTRLVTVGISFEQALLERARNAVYWTPGLTLTELVGVGLIKVIDELEGQNGGRAFAPRPRKNHPGRRMQLAPISPNGLEDAGSTR